MAISKQKKKEIWQSVGDIAKRATTVVMVGYDKLTVAESMALRRKVKASAVSYKAVKKSVALKALDSLGIPGQLPELFGQIALAYGEGDDIIAPAREMFEAGKKYDGKVMILGGIFGGKFITKEEMLAIAAIPPKQTLYGMFVNVINLPIQGLVLGLDAIAKKKLSV